jgi:hypothetical protein
LRTPDPLPIVGIELGARSEASAITVVERTLVGVGEPETRVYKRDGWEDLTAVQRVEAVYLVRLLRRFVTPYRYATIASEVAEIVENIGEAIVAVDLTWTGRPIYSTIRGAIKKLLVPPKVSFFPVTVSWTGGGVAHSGSAGFLVPRRDFISVADEVGVDVESVVSSFREERHRQILEHSLSCAELVNHLPSKAVIPEPPLPRPPKIRAEEEEKPPPKKGFDRKTNTIRPSPPLRHW